MVKKILKNRLFGDFTLNLLATIVTTGATQFVLYPLLSRIYSAVEYGTILTIMGVINTIIMTAGNSLNNVRLVVNADYENTHQSGDFMILLWCLSILGAGALAVYLVVLHDVQYLPLVLLIFFCVLGAFRRYGSVVFRLAINYKNNLLCSCATVIGNLIGITILYVSKMYHMWMLPFLLGECLGVMVIVQKSGIFREPMKRTSYFGRTVRKEIVFCLTTLIGNLLIYLDRLLLLPILGGEAVSYHTVAAFLGKSLGILLGPLSGVLLSYYAQSEFKMTQNRFWKTNLMSWLMAVVFIFGCMICGEWVTGLFYPDLVDAAKPYMLPANIAGIIGAIGGLTQPAVLKFAPTYWQLLIEIIYGVAYLGMGALGAKIGGVQGFTYVTLFATIIKLLVLYGVGHWALREHKAK